MTENQILIVDDELDICEQLVGVLEDKGFRASHVSSSEAALETLKKKNISLILLDIWLNNSKFDGFQTLEKILPPKEETQRNIFRVRREAAEKT